MSTEKKVKITEAQKRDLEVLQQFGSIITAGRGRRHTRLLKMCESGLCFLDKKYGNVFTKTLKN